MLISWWLWDENTRRILIRKEDNAAIKYLSTRTLNLNNRRSGPSYLFYIIHADKLFSQVIFSYMFFFYFTTNIIKIHRRWWFNLSLRHKISSWFRVTSGNLSGLITRPPLYIMCRISYGLVEVSVWHIGKFKSNSGSHILSVRTWDDLQVPEDCPRFPEAVLISAQNTK